MPRDAFDRERAIFPEVVLAFIRATQPKQWEKLESLHGAKTGERIILFTLDESRALEEADAALPGLMAALRPDDRLLDPQTRRRPWPIH